MISFNSVAVIMMCVAFILQGIQLYRFYTKKAVDLFIFIYPVIVNFVMFTLVFNNIDKLIIDVVSFKLLITIVIVEGFMNTNVKLKQVSD